jgi:hypothetical protein
MDMRLVFVFALLFLGLPCVSAQCLKGDCVNGQGVFLNKLGGRYEGAFMDGKRSGIGTYFAPDGSRFMGVWLDNMPHGHGRQIKAGDTVDGVWQKGSLLTRFDRPDPNFTLTEAYLIEPHLQKPVEKDPHCLAGNCFDGNGEYLFDDGDRYVGSFREGKMHGIGIMYYGNGDRYEGDYEFGLCKGKGILFYANGNRYEGDFDKNLFHGTGSFYYSDSTANVGLWSEGAFLGAIMGDLAPLPPTNPNNMQSWAVVVGVSQYTAMPPLNYTDDDARLLADFLRSPQGGGLDDEHLKLLVDSQATKANITAVLEETFGKAGPNDLIVFYFSGHGMPGAFLPIDYDGESNVLSHGEVNSYIFDSRAKFKLCLADACHSGSYEKVVNRTQSDQTLRKFYSSFDRVREGFALVLSSRGEEYSLESSGLKQGLFSHFLIKGLSGLANTNDDDIINVTELYDFLQKGVSEFSAGFQNPIITGNYDPNMTVGVVEK